MRAQIPPPSRYQGVATLLRAASFMENWAWSLRAVHERGVLPSMFWPVDKGLPMVSRADIGRTAASLLAERPAKARIVELHGPGDCSPVDAAAVLSELLGRPVRAREESPTEWSSAMLEAGFSATTVRVFVEMFDGFNTDLIVFEGGHETRRGEVSLRDARAAVVHGDALVHHPQGA